METMVAATGRSLWSLWMRVAAHGRSPLAAVETAEGGRSGQRLVEKTEGEARAGVGRRGNSVVKGARPRAPLLATAAHSG